MSGGRGAGPSLRKRQNPSTDRAPCPRASSLAMFSLAAAAICRHLGSRRASRTPSSIRTAKFRDRCFNLPGHEFLALRYDSVHAFRVLVGKAGFEAAQRAAESISRAPARVITGASKALIGQNQPDPQPIPDSLRFSPRADNSPRPSLAEKPEHPDAWRLGPMQGPKSPRF
jgi:hypothetical protein